MGNSYAGVGESNPHPDPLPEAESWPPGGKEKSYQSSLLGEGETEQSPLLGGEG